MPNWSYNVIINLKFPLLETDHTLTLFLCLTDELDVTLLNFLFLHLTQMNTSGIFVFFILAQER